MKFVNKNWHNRNFVAKKITHKKAIIVFCSLIYAMHFLFQVLHLSHNKLKKLPDSIGDLKMLQTLDVSHNSLKELPETLSKVCSPWLMNDSFSRFLIKHYYCLLRLIWFFKPISSFQVIPNCPLRFHLFSSQVASFVSIGGLFNWLRD